MTARALADGIRALAPSLVPFHFGTAPASAELPWGVLNVSIPDVDARSLASTRQTLVGRVLVTIAAGTEDGVQIVGDAVLDAFEGARPVAEGWRVSPLRQVGEFRIFPDDDVVTTATNLRPMVGKVTFEYTATRV